MEHQSLHGTLISHQGIGCLILGWSGSGKSRLAIEAMMLGAKLIADDQVQLSLNTGMLMGAPARGLQGVIEMRGLGLVKLPDTAGQHVVHLIAEITQIEQIERLPTVRETRELLGHKLPVLRLPPPPASSGAMLLWAIRAIQDGRVLPSDWKPSV